MTNDIQTAQHDGLQQGEIILYQPDETVRLERLRVGGLCPGMVRLEDDTVWLTQAQMAELFQKDQSVIARHIGNVFREGELDEMSNMQILHNTLSKYKPTKVYNLNVIISVGYRVKSKRGTQFRIWATSVLRDFILRGYAFNQRMRLMKEELYTRLNQLEKRGQGVDATIYTEHVGQSLLHLQQLNLQQYGRRIEIREYNSRFHDRFLILDDSLYHFGASLKDLGRKWFAFTLMHDITATELINRISGSTTVNIEQ